MAVGWLESKVLTQSLYELAPPKIIVVFNLDDLDNIPPPSAPITMVHPCMYFSPPVGIQGGVPLGAFWCMPICLHMFKVFAFEVRLYL